MFECILYLDILRNKPCENKAYKVGVAGFEPATSSSQTRRDNRATLHPDIESGSKFNVLFLYSKIIALNNCFNLYFFFFY